MIFLPVLESWKKLLNPGNLVIFDDVYILQPCIFDFPKFVYYANDTSKCFCLFFFSRSGISFSAVGGITSKFFKNLRAKLVMLTNFLAGKLLLHIDLVDFWQHHQNGLCRNQFLFNSDH